MASFLAVGLKDNIDPNVLLADPAEIIDEPPPKPETVGTGEDAAEVNARVLRDQAAVQRVKELNLERWRKGPRIRQNWFYHEAEARLKFWLFFSRWVMKARRDLQTRFHILILVLRHSGIFALTVKRCLKWNATTL